MIIKLRNGYHVIDGDTHHAAWIAEKGLMHDEWMWELIERTARLQAAINRGNNKLVYIDGGCNVGSLTVPMLRGLGKHGRVIAFDPNPECCKCTELNVAKDIPNPQLTVYDCGLGAHEHRAVLRANANVGASFLESDFDLEDRVPLCRVAALDDLLLVKEDEKVGFLKLDIEGYETAALRGAKTVILRHRPVMILEVNRGALARAGSSANELTAFVRAYGYDHRILQPNCKPEDEQYDIICRPF